MNNCFKITFYLSFLFFTYDKAQILFTSIPNDLQLIPRNSNNIGVIVISGQLNDTLYTQIRTKIIDNSSNTILEDKITVIDSLKSFHINHQITAALKEYNILIYKKKDSNEVLVKTILNIVCGDIFIITGQSNALAALDYDNPSAQYIGGTTQNLLYSNQYCRSIGTNMDIALYREDSLLVPVYEDYKFARPTSIYWENGYVGAWGIKLQNAVANQTGIPNCIINSGMSSSGIDFHLSSNYPSDSTNLNMRKPYDRLFKKLLVNGCTNSIKAIFWYQGETDAALSYTNTLAYKNKFEKLYTSWKQDYPSVEKVFIFQINTGCSANESNGSLLREIQRKIPDTYNDVVIMSTVGSNLSERSNDNCHYTLSGHNNIADKMIPVVEKYIYNFSYPDSIILPPKIKKIYVSTSNQICLQFDMTVNIQDSAIVKGYNYFLKDYFYGTNFSNLSLTSISAAKNNVYLNFPINSTLPQQITYLPNSFANNNLYVGPWILNSTHKIGALSFFEFPVEPQKIETIENNAVLSPNPAKDKFTVSFNNTNLNSDITITNLQGQKLLEINNYKNNTIEINSSLFDIGLYFVTVKNDSLSVTKKLIIN